MPLRRSALCPALAAIALVSSPAARADEAPAQAAPARAQQQEQEEPPPPPDMFDSGKLLATGGVSQVEGAGGGGLAPWALITGYGTRNAIGGNAHYTFVGTQDYDLHTGGVAIGLFDRVELSYARQYFDTRDVGTALGLGQGWTIHQNIYGLKVKLFGDAVYDQDTILPQVSVGVQYKENDRTAVLAAIGATDDSGIDYYISATKLILSESLLLNGTVRFTKANQLGILGFGGDRNDDYEAEFEGSAAVLLDKHWAIGAELRTKPDNLGAFAEDDWYDGFLAYFPTKNVSLTLAYVNLGDITIRDDQQGVYASLQVGF